MVVVLKPNGQNKMLGLSSEIDPSKVGMIKKQQQDDEKVIFISKYTFISQSKMTVAFCVIT